MKKIIILFIAISISFIGTIHAATSNLEEKLYKGVIISRDQIEKDYANGIALNKKISEIFIKFRGDKDKIGLEKLRTLLKTKIIELNKKTFLSVNNKKKLNLYNNLYYRTVLLLDYNL